METMVELAKILPVTPKGRREAVFAEVRSLVDLQAAFDLTAFPLPIRIGLWDDSAGYCWGCGGHALHVYMRILPRVAAELRSLSRDPDGKLELNTCTEVDDSFLRRVGVALAVEEIRLRIKDMVLHEVYEALLFRGERIMDPHIDGLRPKDQPF